LVLIVWPVIRPFEAADLPAAGRLLASRHAAHRIAHPLLPVRYEDPATALAEVTALWQAGGASGAVAVDRDQLTGFLIGAAKPGGSWGPNVWVEAAGHATEDPETVRDLYGLAARSWVAAGHTAHYALVPAHDADLVDAWFRLGFGRQHVPAIRDLSAVPDPAPGIRPARRDDIDMLARLDLTLPEHQRDSPVFSGEQPPDLDEARADWARDIDDPAYTTFVAERDGRVLGSAVGCAAARSGIHRGLALPDNAGFLGFAAVFPDARGSGAGRALGEAVIGWAAAAGFDSIVTDWRSTNLLSSRIWPRLGFAETFVRLHRLVGY
jgi:GNAT superfamily N-acetyltransferase